MRAAEEIDAKLFRPLQLGELALAYDQCGKTDMGIGLVQEAMRIVAKTQERMCEAELYRIHGKLLLSKGNEDAAELEFMRALETARLQDTQFWELRATLGLCTIWKKKGFFKNIQDALRPLCSKFGDEADTGDICEARVLLANL